MGGAGVSAVCVSPVATGRYEKTAGWRGRECKHDTYLKLSFGSSCLQKGDDCSAESVCQNHLAAAWTQQRNAWLIISADDSRTMKDEGDEH